MTDEERARNQRLYRRVMQEIPALEQQLKEARELKRTLERELEG